MRFSALTFCTLLATTALVSPAIAQTPGSQGAPPVRQPVDDNGVDVLRLTFDTSQTPISIGGPGSHGLSYSQLITAFGYDPRDSFAGTLGQYGSTYIATIDNTSDSFTLSGSTFTPTEENGATLTLSGGYYYYTNRYGVVARFEDVTNYNYSIYKSDRGVLNDVTYPDGTKVTYHYKSALFCQGGWEGGICQTEEKNIVRVQSVTNSNGYQLKFSYANNNSQVSGSQFGAWSTVTTVKAINNAVEYCSPTADSCTLTNSWPTATIGGTGGNHTITDTANRTTTYTPGLGTFAIKLPGSSSNNITVNFTGSEVTSITRFGVTYSYSHSDSGTTRTTTVTDPNGKTRVYIGDTSTYVLSSFTNEVGKTETYAHDTSGRLTRVTAPEGNYVEYTYDGRGNTTQTKQVAKTTGVPDIVVSAAFPASCTNQKTCNKPDSTTDARGRVTDYTYDSTHGGVLTVTAPEPYTDATRPQVRYSYASKQAYVKASSSASPTATGVSTYKVTTISACQTTSSCSGQADEVKTTIDYGPQTSGTANNLLPVSISKGAGDASLTATTAFTYDNIGNRLTVDGPLSGTADTTRTRYDDARQVVGVIGPDPDGGGSRKHLAQRVTYNSAGLVTNTEVGNVDSQSDSDWANFAPAQNLATTYDANLRGTKQQLQSGGTTYALTQMSYDSLGRPECSAVRMDSSQWSSQTNACTPQTSGSSGPDRISKQVYDDASRVIQVQVGVGTSIAANNATYTYTDNGKVATFKDAENNLTTFQYDGHDRPSKTLYPSGTQGSGTSNSSDYEQLTYETTSSGTRTSGTVASVRNRANQTITFSYDGIGRLTTKNLPGSEPDVTYDYDLLSRMTSASQTGSSLSYGYDALGRKLTETGTLGTATSTWDLAGRRTTLALPGGSITITYDRDVTGQVTAIRENGATSGVGVLASYTYDDLARRTGVTRGNGTSTSYYFDAISRLTSLTQNLAGTTNDLTIGSIAYNDAGQIVSQVRSNDAYSWTGHGNGSTNSTANGLNQLATLGSSSSTYDSKGNLTLDPSNSNSYAYSSENLMTSASGSFSLAYDPAMRLSQVSGGTTVKFGYDGLNMVAEGNSTNAIQRRYVFADGIDEPILWYEGSGTSDRRWLHADERGSVIAISDSNGSAAWINKYDEYGKPGSGNIARFQYTGQAWIPETNAYYYKARFYAAHLGRFMQPDPNSYEEGPNLYAYVGNDPVNLFDPLGLADREVQEKVQCLEDALCVTGYRSPGSIRSDFLINNGGYGYFDTTVGEEYPGGASPSPTQAVAPENAGITITGTRASRPRPSIFVNVASPVAGPNFYPGEPGGMLHWYSDQLRGGARQIRNRLRSLYVRCTTNNSNISGREVARDAAGGAARGAATGAARGAVIGSAGGPIDPLAAAAGGVTGAATGSFRGAATSFVSQACSG